jgi:glycolate oxidase
MPGLVAALEAVVGGDRCLSKPEELLVYECDALTSHRATPSAVVFPVSAGEVPRVVRACRDHGATFVPRGAGTGLSSARG